MQTEKEYITERSIVGLHSESAGEYPLPDYNGDVKRVLMINPRVVPTGKFISEGSVEFSGSVFYDVVYLDAENNVSHADFSTDYELAVKTDAESYEDSYVTTSISAYNVRLVGPRKFSAKCSLASDVRIAEKRTLSVGGDAFDGHEPEILTCAASVIQPMFAAGNESEHKEELLSLDGAIEDEVSVLLCNAAAEVSSVSADSAGADLKGDVTLTVVYKNMNEPIASKSVRVPYSAHVDAADLDTCRSLYGRVDITSLKTEIIPTEDGVIVQAEFNASPSVRGLKNETLDILRDSYLKEGGTSNEYSDFSYAEHICTESMESDFSTSVPLGTLSDGNIVGFAFVNSTVRTDECELDGDRVRIKGEIRFSAIAIEDNGDDGEDYTNVKISAPFEEYVNINCQNHDNVRVECHVDAGGERMEVSDNNALASCSLLFTVTLNSQRKQRCLGASYLTGEEFEHDDSVITVYYPDERESVFDIAKKFHTSVQCIAEDNLLSQAVFASPDSPVKAFGYKKLMIK